jgi:hypothetical protein
MPIYKKSAATKQCSAKARIRAARTRASRRSSARLAANDPRGPTSRGTRASSCARSRRPSGAFRGSRYPSKHSMRPRSSGCRGTRSTDARGSCAAARSPQPVPRLRAERRREVPRGFSNDLRQEEGQLNAKTIVAPLMYRHPVLPPELETRRLTHAPGCGKA